MTDKADMSKPETVSIDSLDQFVRALHQWHSNKVKVLTHLMTIPEGTEVTDGLEDPKVLQGEFREGFILGLKVALHEMGELPFEAEVEFVDQPAKTVH